MQVLSLDPGTHTGYAWLTDAGTLVRAGTFYRETRAALYYDLDELISEFAMQCVKAGEIGTVVIERFVTVSAGVAASADGMLTQKLCGFIEGAAVLRSLQVVWHNSSVRKAYEDNARLLLRPSMLASRPTPHEVSATAHALSYLTRRGADPTHGR